MVKHLIIAGHGKQKDGSFDPGASGFVKQGEHKYVRDTLFPAMKRHLPKGADVVFYSELKVSNHGNLKELVDRYKADSVTEIHFDSFEKESASKGHVIVHEAFAPDKEDLALRDAIKKMVGVRYSHKGHEGISGRDNLRNVNDAKRHGITYRLIELGFGTNRHDSNVMLNQADGYGKELVRALFGSVGSGSTSTSTSSKTYTVKSGDTLWDIARDNNVTVDQLKDWNNIKGDLIHVGDVIKLEGPKRTYTVKKGDSLSVIGARLGVRWQDIAKKNGIKAPYVIRVGQKLEY